MHAPLLRKLESKGHKPKPFKQDDSRPWAIGSIIALGLVAVLPILWPATLPWIQRATPLLSLFFFLAAIGHWMRMGNRSYAVSAFLTFLIYGLTSWTSAAFALEDFYVVALLSSLLVFAMAGFNLVFILEEVMYDAHRVMHLAHRGWTFVPTALVVVLAWTVPFLPSIGAAPMPRLWIASLIGVALLGGWWLFRAFNHVREAPILKELHLLVIGGIAVAAVMDSIALLSLSTGFFPSIFVYGVLVGTWLYVSYTTLQRTQFLLRARNQVPWLLILLSASFALLQHAYLHYRVEGAIGVQSVLNQRIPYLVFGMILGLAFYVAQGAFRLFGRLRDDRALDPRKRILVGRAARIAEGLLSAEHRVIEGPVYRVYRGLDRVLPGRHHAPKRPIWVLDSDSGQINKEEGEEE